MLCIRSAKIVANRWGLLERYTHGKLNDTRSENSSTYPQNTSESQKKSVAI